MLVNAGVQKVIFEGDYPDDFSLEIFRDAKMEVFRYLSSGLEPVLTE